jgi:hypothetical protein
MNKGYLVKLRVDSKECEVIVIASTSEGANQKVTNWIYETQLKTKPTMANYARFRILEINQRPLMK